MKVVHNFWLDYVMIPLLKGSVRLNVALSLAQKTHDICTVQDMMCGNNRLLGRRKRCKGTINSYCNCTSPHNLRSAVQITGTVLLVGTPDIAFLTCGSGQTWHCISNLPHHVDLFLTMSVLTSLCVLWLKPNSGYKQVIGTELCRKLRSPQYTRI